MNNRILSAVFAALTLTSSCSIRIGNQKATFASRGGSAGTALVSVHQPAIMPAVTVLDPAQTSAKLPSFPAPETLKEGGATLVPLTDGFSLPVQRVGGRLVFPIEGTLSDQAFVRIQAFYSGKSAGERKQILRDRLERIYSVLKKANAIALESNDEVGYFSAYVPFDHDLFAKIRSLKFDDEVLINPTVRNPDELAQDKAFTPAGEGLGTGGGADRSAGAQSSARGDTRGFSGLERIGAPQFVAQTQAEIGQGARINGSAVTIGVTDTGITYNHPTFLAADGKHVRIRYLKDFTGEGAIYYNPAANFTATPSANDPDAFTISAQVMLSPKLPALPAGDEYAEVKGLQIKVSPELKADLLANASKARLGVLFEESFNGASEKVDLNQNGATDDKLPAIIILGQTAADDRIYFDPSGSGDFSHVTALGNWNTTHQMVDLFAERIGFDLRETKVPSKDGKTAIIVRMASIVGFDPGNHGSHVSGIAAGRKTIANDDDDTLARGVAPQALLAMNRVCANNGGCSATQALIDLCLNAGVDVINMSLGGLSPFNDGYGVQETLINRLTLLKNVQFVISAGNSGPGRQTVGSPSVARLALSIAATASRSMIERQYGWPGLGGDSTDDDFVLFFSSRGPTAGGGFKPSLSAPGTELSSVQLNAARGSRGGLDVYWGTSMAAPTATGAYALFLDAIKKYNARFPAQALPTEAHTLQKVLMQSARGFDVNRWDPQAGQKLQGQYTWIDQGTGMIDLPSAWKKLKDLRDQALPTALMLDGKPVELDYQVLASMAKNPSGIPYDGSRAGAPGEPAFASGLYLDASGKGSLYTIDVARRLPEALAIGPHAGELTRDLETTQDLFTLKTVFYGTGTTQPWLRAGVRNELGCKSGETAPLRLIGQGVAIDVGADNTGSLDPLPASTLNVCVDRQAIRALPPGDHGALIYAYRTVGDKVSPVASFIVPVYLTVPHQTLAGSRYEVNRTVKSFGVDRNYVRVPPGTSVVKVSLEVPARKAQADGTYRDEDCAGVELMGFLGGNLLRYPPTRAASRIANCDGNGENTPDKKRSLSFAMANAPGGVWDLHVFGSYLYRSSDYRLQVDYVTGSASATSIQGGLAALNGSLNWTVQEASMPSNPSGEKSSFVLDNLHALTIAQVAAKSSVFVDGPLGKLRTYPDEVKEVTITTGGSPGNDIDLTIVDCPTGVTDPADSQCTTAASSGGPTDEEKALFTPKHGHQYAARVDGFDVKDSGRFISTESLRFAAENGTVEVSGTGPTYRIDYHLAAPALAASKLFTHPLFTTGKYAVTGLLTLKTADETPLTAIPAQISAAAASSIVDGLFDFGIGLRPIR